MLEFFDYFLIGFVLAFIIKPWQLTGGQSAVILLSSGVGAILGAIIWGRIADLYGRRKVFILTVLNFSVASGLLYFTPDNGWVYLSVMRFFVGFGVGGLYCVDLPLVQEFVPARRRGFIGGVVTVFIPLGVMLASSFAAFFTEAIGWRGLFLVGLLPAFFTLVIRAWVPESPHWLMSQGRAQEARRSIAWALQVSPESLPLPAEAPKQETVPWTDLFKYPKSLAVSWMASIGAQTAGYGIILWAPTLFVLQLGVTPAGAAKLFLWVTLAGIAGRISFSLLSEATVCIAAAGLGHNVMLGSVSLFWLMIVCADFFYDGGFAVIGPYMAEVWPTRLRTTGMGSAYGFGGVGKIIGPLGLALMIGASDVVKPQATIDAIVPGFLYFAVWMGVCFCAFLFFGFETGKQSLTAIDATLEDPGAAVKRF
jgi:putative MFS transporter